MAYFANSSDDALESQCSSCPLGRLPCPVVAVQLIHNYDQIGNKNLKSAMEMLVDEEGYCQLKPLLKESKGIEDPLAWLDR